MIGTLLRRWFVGLLWRVSTPTASSYAATCDVTTLLHQMSSSYIDERSYDEQGTNTVPLYLMPVADIVIRRHSGGIHGLDLHCRRVNLLQGGQKLSSAFSTAAMAFWGFVPLLEGAETHSLRVAQMQSASSLRQACIRVPLLLGVR